MGNVLILNHQTNHLNIISNHAPTKQVLFPSETLVEGVRLVRHNFDS